MALVRELQSFLRRRVLGRFGGEQWPFEAGNYVIVDPGAPVVVVAANAASLVRDIAALAARGLCMITPSCRSATDVARLVRNLGSNLAIRIVLLIGDKDSEAPALDALRALLGEAGDLDQAAAGVFGSARAKLAGFDIESVRKQLRLVDIRGRMDVDRIIAKVNELSEDTHSPNTGFRAPDLDREHGVERVIAGTNLSYDQKADKAGEYIVRIERDKLLVEHYNSKGDLVRIVEGKTARDLCITLIRNGWVTKLDHSAYLGRELVKAEIAMRGGTAYVQDAELTGAEGAQTKH